MVRKTPKDMKNEPTSLDRTESSGRCSLSYPGGGKGKQRDIGHLPTTNKIAMTKKITLRLLPTCSCVPIWKQAND